MKAIQAKKSRLRRRLLEDMKFARENNNAGLLKKRLFDMPEVTRYTLESGGLQRGYCDVTMSDGYEVCVSGYFRSDILRKAIVKVALRLREKHLL